MPHSVRKIRLRWWLLLAVVALLAQHIARWGRPVPAHYQVESAGSGTQPRWIVARRSNPPETWQARDNDGDGVIDEFDTPAGRFFRPGQQSQAQRWLVICLDGVPLAVMQDLWDRGHFREFHRPSALISNFPSDSETALTEALHTAPVPGYEHRYFDRARNQVRGGAWVTLTGKNIPYLRRFDYDAMGIFKGLHYVVPRKSYRADLGGLRKRFLESRSAVFIAHVSATDALYHIFPAREMEPLLAEFEGVVRDLYLDARGELGVLLFSDHGNSLTTSRATPLESLLQQRGWQLSQRLEGSRDVAVPGYGLVGFFGAYCRDQATPWLAGDLASLEGADLVVFREPASDEATILSSAGGRAKLRWSEDGSRFWYEAQGGDPLDLVPVFKHLRTAGRLAEDGSASDSDLLSATATAHYPDAAARIRGWATNHVRNRSNILVSLKPGYFYGSGIFQHIVEITGTHGALDAASSLGFAMSTGRLPPAMRLAELIPKEFLGGRQRAQPASAR